ncbi:Segregation and condensation protein A [Thalassocella blandensis]|nr:Segregation and condensation protein A [Thalassocella blandensis]
MSGVEETVAKAANSLQGSEESSGKTTDEAGDNVAGAEREGDENKAEANVTEPENTADSDSGQQAETPSEPEQSSDVQAAASEGVADAVEEAHPAHPSQEEMPFAIVQGRAFTQLPKDLYIPPDALEVILEAFEGPLDLLLYLIRRQNLDILEIDVSEITKQYVAYVEVMKAIQFELAAEYLVMAAMLAEIKSRMLLPRSAEVEEEEEDPRATLIRRLQEYERFKQAAEDLDEIPRQNRDTFIAKAQGPDRSLTRPDPDVEMKELLLALSEVLRRADMFESHHIEKERLSTRERMTQVLDRLSGQQFVPFVSLFTVKEGRLGVVVTFLAVMELIKESLVEIVQTEAFGPIHVKAKAE